MNLASSRLPLVLVASGGILIIVSFLWGYVVPTTSINEEQVKALTAAAAERHKAVSVEPSQGSAARPDEESQSPEELAAREKTARAVIQRARFMRETAPKLINYIGVVLAAVGCVLYPLQLLARQAKVEAEREEEDGTTVVE
jgi:hypothetical protein